jgi:hypothetical protein
VPPEVLLGGFVEELDDPLLDDILVSDQIREIGEAEILGDGIQAVLVHKGPKFLRGSGETRRHTI